MAPGGQATRRRLNTARPNPSNPGSAWASDMLKYVSGGVPAHDGSSREEARDSPLCAGSRGVSLSNQRENLSPSTLDGLEFLFDLDFHIFQQL